MKSRGARSIALLVMLLVYAASIHPRLALAHANYVRSTPEAEATLQQAPSQIQVWFSEAVEPAGSELAVFDARGAQVDNGDTQADLRNASSLLVSVKALPQGVYFVRWRTLSTVDGHRAQGSFPFSIGVASPAVGFGSLVRQVELAAAALQPPSAIEALARSLVFIALMLLAGGFAFNALILSSHKMTALRSASSVLRRKVLWGSLVLAAIAFVSAWAARMTQADVLGALTTRVGMIFLARIAVLIGLAVLLKLGRDASPFALALCAALLLTQSLLSHSAAEPEWILPTLADWVHLLGVAIWLGGVATLAFVIAPTVMANRSFNDLGEAIRRFSPFAMASVLVIGLTGVVQGTAFVGSFDALIHTAYGRALLIKIALFLVLIGFGAFHQFVIGPRLNAWRAKAENQQTAANRFRLSIAAEAAASVLVLLAAGALTALPPARQINLDPSAERAAIQSQTVDDLTLTLGALGNGGNPYQLTLRVALNSGEPAASVEKAVLRAAHTAMDMGESEIELQPYGNGNFVAQSNSLSMAGDWQVEAIVRRAGMPDAQAQFVISVQ